MRPKTRLSQWEAAQCSPAPLPAWRQKGAHTPSASSRATEQPCKWRTFSSCPRRRGTSHSPTTQTCFVFFTEEETVRSVEPLAHSWAPHVYDKHPPTLVCINSVRCLCTSHALAAHQWSGEKKILFFDPKKGQAGTNKQASKITSRPLHQAKVWIRRSFLDQLPINPWSNTFSCSSYQSAYIFQAKESWQTSPPCLRLLHLAIVLWISVWYCLHVLVKIPSPYVTRDPNKQPSAATTLRKGPRDQFDRFVQTYWSHTHNECCCSLLIRWSCIKKTIKKFQNVTIQNSILLVSSPSHHWWTSTGKPRWGGTWCWCEYSQIWSQLHWCKTSLWDYSGLTCESLRAGCILPSVYCLCGSDLHRWNESGSTSTWKGCSSISNEIN